MGKFNYTYGILSNGTDGLRTSNHKPSEEQRKYLSALWDISGNKEHTAEFLIRFLRCSEHWPKYCSEFDSVNTYHINVSLDSLSLTFKQLVDWADACPHVSSEFRAYPTQTAIDRVTNKLFGILTIK